MPGEERPPRPAADEVANQPPPLEDFDLFATDAALGTALTRYGAGWAAEDAARFGRRLGTAETLALGEAANRHPPELRTFDRCGRRIDEVDYHPAYHAMMRLGIEAGIHSLPWQPGQAGGHVVHAALEYMLTQVEPGCCCPITMTYASVPALRRAPALSRDWLELILAPRYDPRPLPAAQKGCATIGMAMTEKQGGSDVRANETVATPAGEGLYELSGHKWFCSAPMSDGFLTLARTGGHPRRRGTGGGNEDRDAISCFLVPRRLPDGSLNGVRLQRLKDKLGNRSNASAEIEYHGALAHPVGEEGRGIASIMEMVRHTRLDAAIVSAGMMRQGSVQAIHHACHRRAFGRLLVDQPAMRCVLADLVLEAEAALLLVMRIAAALDAPGKEEAALSRIGSAIAKFWVTKRLPNHAYEALECLGGNGYVEDWPMARLYREAPVNAIWEGSGNVNALDVLRAVARQPETLEAWRAEAGAARGEASALDRLLARLDRDLADLSGAEPQARRLVEDMALALQASLMLRHAPSPLAAAFIAARLDGGMRGCYGALPSGLDLAPIIARGRFDT